MSVQYGACACEILHGQSQRTNCAGDTLYRQSRDCLCIFCLPPGACDWYMQVAHGLQYLHTQGLAHRGLSSYSLFMTNLPQPTGIQGASPALVECFEGSLSHSGWSECFECRNVSHCRHVQCQQVRYPGVLIILTLLGYVFQAFLTLLLNRYQNRASPAGHQVCARWAD